MVSYDIGSFKNQYWVEYNNIIDRTYKEDDLFYANEFHLKEKVYYKNSIVVKKMLQCYQNASMLQEPFPLFLYMASMLQAPHNAFGFSSYYSNLLVWLMSLVLFLRKMFPLKNSEDYKDPKKCFTLNIEDQWTKWVM